jgi:aquaporin Z
VSRERRERPVPTARLCDARVTARNARSDYFVEAAALGVFMISACLVTALVEHPASPVRAVVPAELIRRALVGLAMGLTAVAIVYSPWGKRSGAHINPAVTLAMVRLGRICPRRACAYAAAQFAGAAAGVASIAAAMPSAVAHPSVNFVVTVPGAQGAAAAFGAEVAMAFVLMAVVLVAGHLPRVAPATGLLVGALVALFITIEGPVSGMSLNPARTFGSALVAGTWTSFWLYICAPSAGMLAAAEVYARLAPGGAGNASAGAGDQRSARGPRCDAGSPRRQAGG